ncbi:heterokaryon incompatibility protein-domain-containing protein [Xylariales sp. PMI_506]|nr:heterokaryon incompatibility protein-domain-containing protein [Xylariales sp. PMI_506]
MTRLLELLPGSRQDDIHCCLSQVNLDELEGSYEALSYVWGDEGEVTPIQVDNATLHVRTNLRSALLNLRERDKSRFLWVDAVCINQEDPDEKARQVSIMGTIYRSARRTVIWLGDADLYTKEAFNNLTILENGRKLVAAADQNTEPIQKNIFDLLKNDVCVEHVFGLPWWSRAWTAQEIILASNALVTWGPYQISWDILVGGIEFGATVGIWESTVLGVWNTSPFLSLESILKVKREPPLPNIAENLFRLLVSNRFRHATKGSDKIFSVFGLIGDDTRSIGIEPNYRLPASEIYCKVASQLISIAGNYDIMGACYGAEDSRYSNKLPSWVPDWSSTKYIALPLFTDSLGNPRLTHASKQSKARPRFPTELRDVMVARGQVIGQIGELAAVLNYLHDGEWDDTDDYEGDDLREIVKDIAKDFKVAVHKFGKVVPHLETFVTWEAFVLNLCANRESYEDCNIQTQDEAMELYMQTISAGTVAPGGYGETKGLFQAWFDSLKPIRRLKGWKVDKWRGLFNPLGFGGYLKSSWSTSGEFLPYLKAAYERRLGVTKSGHLCLLPKTTEIGDCLVVLEGGKVPVILRKGTEGLYRFVGEAYVHSMMDGLAFKPESCVEIHIN